MGLKLKHQFIIGWILFVTVVLSASALIPMWMTDTGLFKPVPVKEESQRGTYSIDFTNCKMVTLTPEPGKVIVTCIR